MGTIANSSYLDFTGYRVTGESSVQTAYNLNPGDITTALPYGINVALVLPRAHEPTFLTGNWAERQQVLSQGDGLFAKYGASTSDYQAAMALVAQNGLTVLDSSNSNYVTSQESRTIWVQIDTSAQFNALFGTALYYASDKDLLFWNGDLTLADSVTIKGLWFDGGRPPPPSNLVPTSPEVPLLQGPQSVGNASPTQPALAPQTIAANYNFPLTGLSVPTGTIALIEPGIGTALPAGQTQSFQQLLTQYLTSVGVSGSGTTYVQGGNGQQYVGQDSDERSLDVGTVAAVNPNGTIGLYVGSGVTDNLGWAESTVFTALQSAIWDTSNDPAVISSSFADGMSMSPGSPFLAAYRELLVDAALRNQTVFQCAFDGGSGNETGNGLTNLYYGGMSPYGIVVGGTSISSLTAALDDPTLSAMTTAALQGDLAVIWQLVAGGLTALPANAAPLANFVEAVWNQYYVQGTEIGGYYAGQFLSDGANGYKANWTGTGGVDPTQSTPSYQRDYGLDPVTADPQALHGRGVPDVSALSQGNQNYLLPSRTMVGTAPNGGTSAAAPLWASLGVQLNAVFADQGLPQLGYMNDLLYIASAITPAAFNDVRMGNNISSFVNGTGSYQDDGAVMPTGFGYYAGPGYDLVTGLGTPNGMLLARSMADIAHSQMFFSSVPDVIEGSGDAWQSGADQSVVFQGMSGYGMTVGLDLGQDDLDFSSGPSATYAWTSRLAEQSLQMDFDPALVRLFDKQSQGFALQSTLESGDSLAVSINGSTAHGVQAGLTSDFGFADFMTSQGVVRVAQPVTVAETAGGLDDQTAIVRARQNGTDSLSISFFRVDDYTGAIGGLHPGDAGWGAAADAGAYTVSSGGTSIGGPGYSTMRRPHCCTSMRAT